MEDDRAWGQEGAAENGWRTGGGGKGGKGGGRKRVMEDGDGDGSGAWGQRKRHGPEVLAPSSFGAAAPLRPNAENYGHGSAGASSNRWAVYL